MRPLPNVVPDPAPGSRPDWPAGGSGMHAAADLSPGDVHAPGRIVIANVDDGGHFIYVRDFTGAVGWRVLMS